MNNSLPFEKKYICVVSASQSFLLNGFVNKLDEVGYPGIPMEPIKGVLDDFPLPLCGVAFFVDSELLSSMKGISYFKEYCQANRLPIFLIGAPADISLIEEKIPSSLIKGTFMRPIDMNKIVVAISSYVSYHTTGSDKRTILVVDDSGTFLRTVKSYFENDYQVVPASSAAMAMDWLSGNCPDLILLDYEMPDTDGKSFFERLRGDSEYRKIPVIFLTATNDAVLVNEVVSLHPAGYLLKTVSAEVIIKYVNEYFERE